MADDPFPRERVGAMVRRLPKYLHLSWRLMRDPLLSKARRGAVIGAAGYLASPIDLVPGVIPVLGQLDDIAVAIAALRFALAGLSPEQRHKHLDAVGLADELLVEDVKVLAVTTAWLGRAGVRTADRTGRRVGGAAIAGARVTAPAARRVAAATAPAMRRAANVATAGGARIASAAAPAAQGVARTAGPAVKAASGKAGPVARAAGAKAAPVAKVAANAATPAIRRLTAASGASARLVARRIPGRGARGPEPEDLPVEQEGDPAG